MTTAQEAAAMTIQEEVTKLRKEASDKLAEADRIAKLQEIFPDLKVHVSRWKTVRFCSPTVNSRATSFEIKHNCGCCNDSPLEVRPYLETKHGRVYSDPPCLRVGEKHWIVGDKPYKGWQNKLREVGIPEEIVAAVQEHFNEGRKLRIQIAEEEDLAEETPQGSE
jgi:hypothetical protein